jgi:ectoine hydroxylase-related dioxygenase (phytanoyl-CoA dioxygenase family)
MRADGPELQVADEPGAGSDELFASIASLTAAVRERRDPEAEGRLLRLRHLAGISLLDRNGEPPQYPAPDPLPAADGLPDFTIADLTPSRVRAAILRDGCMVVRNLVPRATAAAFGNQVERAFQERERQESGGDTTPGYYEEFRPQAPFRGPARRWIKEGGGLLAADSPKLAFEMLEMFEAAGVPELVSGYLGEPAAFSVHKTTLRKVEPTVIGGWHQDGAFMGRVRSLNLWLSLSHCGEDAPSLDIVPRRLDELVETGTEGTFMADQASQATAEAAAGDRPIVRPMFEPGDAVIFDDLCLHQTAADPSMTKPRYAIECWFFGASEFPSDYAPIAVSG